MKKNVDVAIVGGGPAGMAAALSCRKNGIEDIIILERDEHLGGILKQCIHDGFGLHRFGEELTGPEYAQRFIDEIEKEKIHYLLNTTVLQVSREKKIFAVAPQLRVVEIQAKAVILAMGCRERTRGALCIPGDRPAGVYTAGMAQRLVNLEGYMPGKDIVILGSGDIGLIMARRMIWEGANVKMICEIMPYSTGLVRNVRQCVEDYGIPLKFNHTVINIHGKERVEGVTIAQVDKNRRPIPGSEEFVSCDTLLLSVGLIPENELSEGAGIELDPRTGGPVVDEFRQTSVPGIFACGNVLHVHDLVDYVSEEGELAGEGVARFLRGLSWCRDSGIHLVAGVGIRYVVPHYIQSIEPVEVFFRVDDMYENVFIEVLDGEDVIYRKKYTRLSPGKMQRIKLNPGVIKKIDGGKKLELRCRKSARRERTVL